MKQDQPPKMRKYTPNGTGRDGYIHTDHGGLYPSVGSRPFHTTLREHSALTH